jgi:hypothetical protein
MRALATGLLLVFGMMPAAASEKAARTRVYVYTSPSASVQLTDEEKGRMAAVDDMRDALRKKKQVALVDDRSQAEVLVDVTGREQREAPSGGFGGKMITALGDTIIRVHVVSGDEQADLKGIGQGTWGRAAKDAAERIVKWMARREPRRVATDFTNLVSRGLATRRTLAVPPGNLHAHVEKQSLAHPD